MKIVYLDFDDIKNPLLGAGQAVATKGVGMELTKRGHEVVCICSRYPGCEDRIENGIKYKHIGLGSKYIRLNNVAYFFALPFAVINTMADIFIECSTAPISMCFTPLFTRVPVVVLPSMFNAAAFSRKYHLPFHWVEKIGFKLYKYALPYSDVDSSRMLEYKPDLIYKIVKQGVGAEYFQIQKSKPEYILYLGRYDIAQKGVDLLLESYSKVSTEINFKLVIAGHGPDESKIRNLIKHHGLEQRVEMIGSTYGQKKLDVMSRALCVAFPSRHDEMCLWVLEALAGGLPIICFDLPESAWMSEGVSLKAKRFDTYDYAQLLLKVSDERIAGRYSENAREFASHFKWENVAEDFETFFLEVVKYEKKQA